MTTPFLTRKSQFLAKIQSVAGTAETLAAADGKVRVNVGMGFDYQAPKIVRDIARASLSPLGMIASTKAGAITLRTEINTPDTMTSLPEHETLLRASGHVVDVVKRIAIGAITSGPISRGATLTGGTSSGTGRLVLDATNGDTHLYYVPISGTLQSGEVITGTGGATCTSSGAPASYGASVRPLSTFPDFITARYENDGYAWSVRDAVADMSFEIEASKQGFFDFAILGAKGTFGTLAMTSSISYDTGEPPILQNAGLTIGSSFQPVFSKVSFAQNNKNVLRQNGNAAGTTGIEGARITGREPKFKITLEHVVAATKDFFANYDASTKEAIKFQCGTTVGKRFFFFAPLAEISALPIGDAEGIRTLEVEFLLTSTASVQSADGEYEMLFL